MGQITATRNLVATKVVRLAGQWPLKIVVWQCESVTILVEIREPPSRSLALHNLPWGYSWVVRSRTHLILHQLIVFHVSLKVYHIQVCSLDYLVDFTFESFMLRSFNWTRWKQSAMIGIILNQSEPGSYLQWKYVIISSYQIFSMGIKLQ